MYLSRILINTQKYETMRALYNLEIMHGIVERTFDGNRQRNLWRVDKFAGEYWLLLLSSIPPENNRAAEQIGYVNSSWETKSYETLLKKIEVDSKWRFKLIANPTISTFIDSTTRGKIKAITTTHGQREWMEKQGNNCGFSLESNQYDVVSSEWKTFKKKNREIQVIAATFEGVLTVTDKEKFKNALLSGIGREKAYGMGLLTVIPYE